MTSTCNVEFDEIGNSIIIHSVRYPRNCRAVAQMLKRFDGPVIDIRNRLGKCWHFDMKMPSQVVSSSIESRILEKSNTSLPLSHELAHYLNVTLEMKEERQARTACERRVASIVYAMCDLSRRESIRRDFDSTIIRIAKNFDARNTTKRNCNVGTVDTKTGGRVIFPKHQDIDKLLKRLSHEVIRASEQSATFGALVAWIGMMGIHPIIDGNGRTSRVLFNVLLGLHGENYIPLGDLTDLVSASFTLSLREAIYFGDWSCIAALVAALLDEYFDEALGDPIFTP